MAQRDGNSKGDLPKFRLGSVVRLDTEQDGPTHDPDREDGHDGDTTALYLVGVGREEEHEDESDDCEERGETGKRGFGYVSETARNGRAMTSSRSAYCGRK